MSIQSFFGLQNVSGWTIIGLLFIIMLATLFLVAWKFDVFRKVKSAGLSYLAFLPLLGRRFRHQAVEAEACYAKKGIQYAPESTPIEERRKRFMEFIKDMPLYCINDDLISRIVRSTMGNGGANYQQVVLHDSSSIDDVYLWIRREGNYFFHNKGVYLFPWDCQKRVLHWDIQDCRPMEDKSPAAQWPNPKMNARYFWGNLNSVAMNKQPEEETAYTKYILYGVAIVLVVSIYIAYSMGKADEQQLALLQQIAENTKKP